MSGTTIGILVIVVVVVAALVAWLGLLASAARHPWALPARHPGHCPYG